MDAAEFGDVVANFMMIVVYSSSTVGEGEVLWFGEASDIMTRPI